MSFYKSNKKSNSIAIRFSNTINQYEIYEYWKSGRFIFAIHQALK